MNSYITTSAQSVNTLISQAQSEQHSKAFNIIIADNHSIIRWGVAKIIQDHWHQTHITFAKDFDQVLAQLNQTSDILICEIDMPGGNTFDMIDKIKQKRSDLKIILFSSYNESIYANRYLEAGANGFLSKQCDLSEIIQAVEVVLKGGNYGNGQLNHPIIDAINGSTIENPINILSNRELEISMFLITGLGGLEICNRLNLKAGTVSTYKKRIYQKLGIVNINELRNKLRLHLLSA